MPLTPNQIKKARQTAGLSMAQAAQQTGGKADRQQWNKFENGSRPLPLLREIILLEIAAGLPEFTINTDVHDALHWIEHTRYPRIKWRVRYDDDGAEIIEIIHPMPADENIDYIGLSKRAADSWVAFHNET